MIIKLASLLIFICSSYSLNAGEVTTASEGVEAIDVTEATIQYSLAQFILGHYILVGKAIDSQETYTGKLHLYREDANLVFQRHINGSSITGTAQIKKASNNHTNLLQMNFSEENINYQQTCLIQGDLDNYARISCYLYPAEGATDAPGLEALFRDHTQ